MPRILTESPALPETSLCLAPARTAARILVTLCSVANDNSVHPGGLWNPAGSPDWLMERYISRAHAKPARSLPQGVQARNVSFDALWRLFCLPAEMPLLHPFQLCSLVLSADPVTCFSCIFYPMLSSYLTSGVRPVLSPLHCSFLSNFLLKYFRQAEKYGG